MVDDLFSMMESMHDERTVERNEIIWAPFGYLGGKSRLVQEILDLLPVRNSFIDVFAGSGVITLNRPKSRLDVYNDRYSGVTQFYRCVRDPELKERLVKRIELAVYGREEFVYAKENWQNEEFDLVERAALWYCMIVMSFNSLGRNFGRSTSGLSLTKKTWTNLSLVEPIHQRLRTVTIENLDFRECIKDYANKDAVFYLDPPYLGVDQSGYAHKFNRADHINMLDMVFSSPGYFAVSGYENDLYDKYPWTKRHEWHVPVSVLACAFNEHNFQQSKIERERTYAKEVLYVKNV